VPQGLSPQPCGCCESSVPNFFLQIKDYSRLTGDNDTGELERMPVSAWDTGVANSDEIRKVIDKWIWEEEKRTFFKRVENLVHCPINEHLLYVFIVHNYIAE
jgi:hypothetical protein